MFTVLSKVLSYFWTIKEEDHDEETVQDEERLENTVGPKYDLDTDHKGGNSHRPGQSAVSSNVKYVNGTVTHLFNMHGLVDEEIYFSFDKIIAETVPGIGDTVSVTASRKNEFSGWYAEQVCVASGPEWEMSDAGAPKMEPISGRITEYKNNKGLINNKRIFTDKDVVENFTPVIGDYVTADLIGQGKSAHVSNIRPQRMTEKDGAVTFIGKGYGYIDNNILFTFDSCQEGFRPRRMEEVNVAAIESSQGHCEWRALSVKPRQEVQVLRLNIQELACDGVLIPQSRTDASSPAEFPVPREVPQRTTRNRQFRSGPKGKYPVPKFLPLFIEEDGDPGTLYPALKEELTVENFEEKMSILLHLEELERVLNYKQFSLKRVVLRNCSDGLFVIEDPKLEGTGYELVPGDTVEVTCSDYSPVPHSAVKGSVEKLEDGKVYVALGSNFSSNNLGTEYNIDFQPNRFGFIKQHRAVRFMKEKSKRHVLELKRSKERTLSNPQSNVRNQKKRSTTALQCGNWIQNHPEKEGEFFTKNLNQRQKDAVCRILDHTPNAYYNHPYVIFGPPGTGKTVTVVEIILQLLTNKSDNVLVCAQSNSACNNIATKLLDMHEDLVEDHMVRLLARSVEEEDIPESLLPYLERLEPLENISRKRLTICTLSMAGSLMFAIKKGHYKYVIVDEAGQATEPEICCALSFLQTSPGQIILAGDPHQLGPVIKSKWAKLYGLETSFLSRLLKRPKYLRNTEFIDNYDPQRVTKLVYNYRSHEALLKISSQLFYDDELEFMADKKVTHSLSRWTELPTSGCPIIFHGVKGLEEKVGGGYSWCNVQEAMMVAQYLTKLLGDPSLGLTGEDIGVITPYTQQAQLISRMVEIHRTDSVKIAVAEEFQGQERKVIILSTVRTNEELSERNPAGSLGFIVSPQRFNVALTRAQALLIVIGNPVVLEQNEYWGALLAYCVRSNACIGYQFSEADSKWKSRARPDDVHVD